MARRKLSIRATAVKNGYRSGLEHILSKFLDDHKIEYEYEKLKIKYVVPAKEHTYTPDFNLGKMIVETKGRFLPDDRKKMLLVKEQHPEYDIRLVFSNSKTKLTKNSKTSYADWCDKNGFQWADKVIPDEWIKECKSTK
jgi:hypothetical protein